MKTKYSRIFGLLAIMMLVASFVLPVNPASPKVVQADPGICKWDTLKEPGSLTGTEVIAQNSDIVDLVVGNDFNTVVAVVNEGPPTYAPGPTTLFKWSNTKGLFWSSSKWSALAQNPAWTAGRQVYQVAMAPDNPSFFAITSDNSTPRSGPKEVWITRNGGSDWYFTNLAVNLSDNETIRCIDISPDYGGKRDIVVGTATGNGNIPGTDHGHIFVVKSSGFSSWQDQKVNDVSGSPIDLSNGLAGHQVDFFAVKFSPFYASDSSMAVVFASDNITTFNCTDRGATFYNVAVRDIDQNSTLSWVFTTPGVEVTSFSGTAGTSPGLLQLNKATLQLPSDFSGQTASLRRAYISTDAFGSNNKTSCSRDGVFRIDDSTVSTLMDTSQSPNKSIYSIAYFGTYATGKLMAGEHMGFPCTATVPTWFTDSPATCAGGCWYPAIKPTTGAACSDNCAVGSQGGVGAAIVAWAPQGNLAYVATGAAAYGHGVDWWAPLVAAPTPDDESALGISRDNGETWNQISLIDTVITKFTDVAPTPDCKTIYLASVNVCGPAACSVVATANVTAASPAHGGSTITLLTPIANCGNTITATDNTTSITYHPNGCSADWSISLNVTLHCACSTCQTCTVGPFNDTASGIIQTDNGTAKTQIVTLTIPVSCAGQPGCTTNLPSCCCFDSVWRTSSNPDAVLPLPPQPVGTYWERVFTHVTAPDCTLPQTDRAILRIVPYCTDPTGEIVAWAVYDHEQTFNHGIAAWSPDFGDYWAMITPRHPVQDFCFESRTVMYFLSPDGLVQKMPYTGITWSSSLADVDTGLSGAHTIAAYPNGRVLVGADSGTNAAYFATSYCGNFNTDSPSFAIQVLSGSTGGGNVHVAFDPNFKDNNIYYIGVDNQPGLQCIGSVFRNNPFAQLRWQDTDMMAAINGAIGCPHPIGQYGIVLAFTGQALYTAHTYCFSEEPPISIPCGVDRTIDDGTGKYGPLSGMPKPGIAWDHLNAGFPESEPCFTLEPSSLKICGCCDLSSDSTLYAIDNAPYSQALKSGLIWAFTDCLAKRGPALVTEDKTLIGCDPVSGRAQEVNLCWEQLCVADAYNIEIAKDNAFTIRIIDWVSENNCGPSNLFLHPSDVTAPCVYFPAGGMVATGDEALSGPGSAIAASGNLECGHTYYWRVKARECATTQVIRSPWSETRSFTVKAGLPVVSSYQGLQLLAPDNGCLGCPVQPASFSWSPYKETTKYKFDLATDAAMTQIVKEAETTTTAYEYNGKLNYSTNYFWRVMSEEPAPSDWSAIFSFQTVAKPAAAPGPAAPAPTPIWVWVVIAIGAILVIVTLVLIFKTRRV